MINYYDLFKNDFFSGVSALTKKTGKRILWAYLIYYGSSLVMAGIFAAIALLGVLDLSFFADMLADPSPENSILMMEYFADMITTPEFIISFIILMTIMIIFASWNYYFAFITVDSEIKDDRLTFPQLFKMSFSGEVFKLVGITIVLNIILTVMFLAAAFSASLSGILALLLFLIALVMSMRFLLVMPAYIIGNYEFSSSFAFSFYHINWGRALKFLGICLLAFLVILGVSLIVGLISGLFSLIPFIGPLIQIALNVVLGAIIMATTVSALVGLYYRYADIKPSETTTTVEE